jgi:hypothetical protein
MEPWRVLRREDQWSQFRIILMTSRILVRIKVKSWIRMRIEVMRIRNPGFRRNLQEDLNRDEKEAHIED